MEAIKARAEHDEDAEPVVPMTLKEAREKKSERQKVSTRKPSQCLSFYLHLALIHFQDNDVCTLSNFILFMV